MASVTDIYNQALSNIGVTRFVSDIDDGSLEAEVCSQWYSLVRDELLRSADWPFARRRVALALVSDGPDHWEYQYRYPSDCLFLRSIVVSGIRNPRTDQRTEFEIASDDTGRVIWTDMPDAEAIYTRRIESAEQFDPLVVTALSWALSARIAMPMAVDMRLAQLASQQYSLSLQRALAAAFNEGCIQQPDPAIVSLRF